MVIANIKGGVGKTTTALHFAAALQQLGPTLLIDSDEHQSALAWADRGAAAGRPLPFRVASLLQAGKLWNSHRHIVIDTGQNPSKNELHDLNEDADLLIVPAVPMYLDAKGTSETVDALRSLSIVRYRVLLNRMPPAPETDGAQLRAAFTQDQIPLFAADIPRLKIFDKASTIGTTVSDAGAFHGKDRIGANRAWAAFQAAVQEILLNA